MPRVVLLSLLCAALTGCGGGWSAVGSSSDVHDGQSSVRSVIPALEAHYADHGTYAGATLARLRSLYDPSLGGVRIVSATSETYCVESTGPAAVFSKRGPAADIVDGSC